MKVQVSASKNDVLFTSIKLDASTALVQQVLSDIANLAYLAPKGSARTNIAALSMFGEDRMFDDDKSDDMDETPVPVGRLVFNKVGRIALFQALELLVSESLTGTRRQIQMAVGKIVETKGEFVYPHSGIMEETNREKMQHLYLGMYLELLTVVNVAVSEELIIVFEEVEDTV